MTIVQDTGMLSEAEYQEVRAAVIEAPFNKALSGRQVLPLRKVSEGRQTFEYDTLNQTGDAELISKGTAFPGMEVNKTQTKVSIVKTGISFQLYKEDLLSSRMFGEALDVSAGRRASKKVDIKENDVIINGSTPFGINGIADASGTTATGADWTTTSNDPYNGVRKAAFAIDVEFTANVGLFNPTQYGELFRRESNTQRLYIELIQEALGVKCFKDSDVTAASAYIMDSNPDTMELVVAQEKDMEEAYEIMNQSWKFNVSVRSVPVFYQANAICTLSSI